MFQSLLTAATILVLAQVARDHILPGLSQAQPVPLAAD